MFSTRELLDEIATLTTKLNSGQPIVNRQLEEIKLVRLHFALRYAEACDEKNAAIDTNRELSWDYDKKVLMIIRDILDHTRTQWALETDEQRKGSLHNIVRLVLLLRRDFTRLYNVNYSAQPELAEEINLWRNLGFLVQCQITSQDYGVRQSIPISANEINTILRECFPLIDTVLREEIRVGLKLQTIQERNQEQKVTVRHEHMDAIRESYRNPYALPYINAFVTHKREHSRLIKMQQAIAFALTLDMNNPTHRMALIRQLQIIGESMTGKNFSKQTCQLANDIDWQLFIHLRNKLSHNEWDIPDNILTTQLTAPVLQNIQQDLRSLQSSLQNLQGLHQAIGQDPDRMVRHYSPHWYLRPEARRLFLDFITDLDAARLIDRQHFIRFKNYLDENIRGRNPALPIEIQQAIAPVFDPTSARYSETKRFLPQFQALREAYSKELIHFDNLENPDPRAQERNRRRLAIHHTNIRTFENALNYDEHTYERNWRQNPKSFDPLRIIGFISADFQAIQNILSPLPDSDALTLGFPEDTTTFYAADEKDPGINQLLTNAETNGSLLLRQAVQNIRNYAAFTGSPLHLEFTGLRRGIARGELQGATLEDLQREAKPEEIQQFGKKCGFYLSLARNPAAVEACFYHMARIQKYMVVLCRSNEIPANLLPHLKEFKALRNFIHHGIDLFETMNIASREFMTRYAVLFINRLLPAIQQAETHIQTERQKRAQSRFEALLANGLHRLAPAVDPNRSAAAVTRDMRRRLSFS